MVIGHEAILGGVHAHRGDNDTVGDSQVLGSEGLEEQGEGRGTAFSGGSGSCGGTRSGGDWGDDVEVLLVEGLFRDVAFVEGIGDGVDGLIVISGRHAWLFCCVWTLMMEEKIRRLDEG
jgi:hypothetical protein